MDHHTGPSTACLFLFRRLFLCCATAFPFVSLIIVCTSRVRIRCSLLLLLSENTWQNQSNKGSVYFDHSAGVAHRPGRGWWQSMRLITFHPQARIRKRWVRVLSSLSSFYFVTSQNAAFCIYNGSFDFN